MSDLELGLLVLGMAAVGFLLFGPGYWSEHWGWGFLDRLFGKNGGKKKPPSDSK